MTERTPPRRPRDVVRTALRRALGTWWGRAAVVLAGLVALAAGVTAALGGFDRVEAAQLPQWEPGARYDIGQTQVTILDHTVTDEHLADRLPDGASAWLAVRAVVEPSEPTTLSMLATPVLPPEETSVILASEYFNADRVILLRDATLNPQIHPGLPEEVAFLWPVEDPARVPDPLEVEVLASTPQWSALAEEQQWSRPEPVATMSVPRTQELPGMLERHEEW